MRRYDRFCVHRGSAVGGGQGMNALIGLGLCADGAKEAECSDREDLGGFHYSFLSKVDLIHVV
jgi:hypothetical protein